MIVIAEAPSMRQRLLLIAIPDSATYAKNLLALQRPSQLGPSHFRLFRHILAPSSAPCGHTEALQTPLSPEKRREKIDRCSCL